MTGLAAFRILLGAFAWFMPRRLSRMFGVAPANITPELDYMNRVFGVRAVALGTGYLASRGEARELWHRLWMLCDAADTVMGVRMVARREIGGLTGAAALATTGGALAVDLAALRDGVRSRPA